MAYISSKDDVIAAGDLVMCRYLMTMEGCETVGCVGSCVQHGMVQCQFDRSNKIIACEIMFDVMGYMQQLQVSGAASMYSIDDVSGFRCLLVHWEYCVLFCCDDQFEKYIVTTLMKLSEPRVRCSVFTSLY